jgi:hypothetical protein
VAELAGLSATANVAQFVLYEFQNNVFFELASIAESNNAEISRQLTQTCH